MIFVADPDNCVGCGDTLQRAFQNYQETYDNYPFDDLKVFEGEEVEVEYVLKPKVKKEKK